MADQPIHRTKVCTKCGAEKPRTEEFFHFCNGYPRPRCRPCWREWEKEYFDRNRESKRAAKKRQWAKADKAVQRAKVQEWKAANHENTRAIEVRRLQRISSQPELRAKAASRMKRWRDENPEREATRRRRAKEKDPTSTARYSRSYAERHPERMAAKGRAWRKKNPAKVIAYSEMRRQRVRAAEGEITEQVVLDLVERSGMVCFYCMEHLTSFHVDHFIPVTRGGSNLPENLRVACGRCNRRKSNKLPWEWMPERFSPP